MIDTHSHVDGEEFFADLAEVVSRARAAGVERICVPAIDLASCRRVLDVVHEYAGYLFPMLGLHPEEVRDGFRGQLSGIKQLMREAVANGVPVVAVGEIGLDFYWSREYMNEQIEAFRIQTEWSIELKLPLMIHCRKAQNEMVHILKEYESDLVGGVFHCFTGNSREAEELLRFDRFLLGIGGVLTFKKSSLPQTLAASVPLDRIVLETDAPYMTPVPLRGTRNESANLTFILNKLAETYSADTATVDRITTANAVRCLFPHISCAQAE
ncbi:MAG: TatD family hydrolase [Prevotella sp.]|nr:TatD family hydrolase [Prevotella sp.]